MVYSSTDNVTCQVHRCKDTKINTHVKNLMQASLEVSSMNSLLKMSCLDQWREFRPTLQITISTTYPIIYQCTTREKYDISNSTSKLNASQQNTKKQSNTLPDPMMAALGQPTTAPPSCGAAPSTVDPR